MGNMNLNCGKCTSILTCHDDPGSQFVEKFEWPQTGQIKYLYSLTIFRRIINAVFDYSMQEESDVSQDLSNAWGVAESQLDWAIIQDAIHFSYFDVNGYNLLTDQEGQVASKVIFNFSVDAQTGKYIGRITNVYQQNEGLDSQSEALAQGLLEFSDPNSNIKNLSKDGLAQLTNYVQMLPEMMWETWSYPYQTCVAIYEFHKYKSFQNPQSAKKQNNYKLSSRVFDKMLTSHQNRIINQVLRRDEEVIQTLLKDTKHDIEIFYDPQLQRPQVAYRISSAVVEVQTNEERVREHVSQGRVWIFQWDEKQLLNNNDQRLELNPKEVRENIQKCKDMIKIQLLRY